MSWCQGFVGKVYDPLRVRFFLGRTLGRPTGGRWRCYLPGGGGWPPGKPELTYCWGASIALPRSPSCVASLTCQGGPKGVRVRGGICLRSDSFPGKGGRVDARGVLASPGGRAVARDALASPGGRANASTGRAEARGVLASPGGRANAGGRVVLAWEGRAETGEALASPGGRASAWTGRAEAGGVLASLGGRANAGGRVVLAWEGRAGAGGALASPEGRANAGGGAVLAWEGTVPSLGGYLPEKEGWPGKEWFLPWGCWPGNYLDCMKLSYLCEKLSY